ncbi:MAG: hypothetical protein M3082_06480 [Candidatus Dormibacteraeota bacterium]|nr:hypothetical protein [Candidatus Dormibacteraeota bacterium]
MRYIRPEPWIEDAGETTAAPSLLSAVVESPRPRPIVGYWRGASGKVYPTTVLRQSAPRATAQELLFQAAMLKVRAETEMYRLMGLFIPGRKSRPRPRPLTDEERLIAAVNGTDADPVT